MLKSEAIAYFGSQSKMAKALHVSRQSIGKLPDKLPDRIAWQVELIQNNDKLLGLISICKDIAG
jgi:hypothetical protein